jgi:hypothetical protein
VADDKPDEWPRALRGAYDHADPTDPTLPPAPPGSAVEAAIAAKLAGKFPQYNDPDLKPIQFAEVFARLLALSVARLEFLGALLAAEYERHRTDMEPPSDDVYHPGSVDNDQDGGIRALIGDVYDLDKDGIQVPTGEAVRALVKLEAEERDRAARLAKEAIRIGVKAAQVDVMRSYGHTVVAALRAFAEQQGIDWAEEGTRKAAQRAILTARSRLGAESLTVRGNDERD